MVLFTPYAVKTYTAHVPYSKPVCEQRFSFLSKHLMLYTAPVIRSM